MDDLSAAINQFMSNPDNMRQLQEVASSLGLGGDGFDLPRPSAQAAQPPPPQWNHNPNMATANNPLPSYPQEYARDSELSYIRSMLEQLLQNQQAPRPAQPNPMSAISGLAPLLSGGAAQQPPGGDGGLNLSALSGILSGLGGGKGASPDLSGLSGLLGGLSGASPQQSAAPTGLSALTSMLGGDKAQSPSLLGGGSPGGMDLGMLMKFQQAMSSISANAGNVKLLLGLKSHLKDPQRASKVDDAIRVMQVIQFLPLLKESGLFGKMEEILNGVGLGSIGDVLGGLTGGR